MKNEIIPGKVNPTEERQLQLLFNLLKYKNGLSLETLQNRLMPQAYNNENRDSDRKKFRRDIDELKQLGFAIKRYADDLDENKSLYKIVNSEDAKIKFTDDELKQLSLSIFRHFTKNQSPELFSAAGKIFASHLQFFPPLRKKQLPKEKQAPDNNELNKIEKLVQCLRDHIPIRIEYTKTTIEKENREIEPLQMVKRNREEFYLIAWDRKEKAIRRFLIPKIGKVTEIDGDFLFRGELTPDDLNFHPLNVHLHPPETFRFVCNSSYEWKMENFLSGHPYQKENKIYTVTATNKYALIDFLLRENNIVELADDNLLQNLSASKQELLKIYES